jgi:hypothetical protein
MNAAHFAHWSEHPAGVVWARDKIGDLVAMPSPR